MRKLSVEEERLLFGQDEYTINCDKWDVEDFSDVKSCSSDLLQLEESGKEVLETFPELMQDVYNDIYKAAPKLREDWEVKKEMLFNRAIMEQVHDHRRIKEIRTISTLDPMASSVGVHAFSGELMEILEEEKEKQKQFEDLMQAAQEYQDALEGDQEGEGAAQGKDGEDEDGEGVPGQSPENLTLQEAKKRLEDAHKDFKNSFKTPEFQGKLGQALTRIKHQVIETNNMLQTWGLSGDDGFTKLGHREKMEWMEKLRHSNKLKKIAELAGRMTALAMSQQNQKVKRGSEEVYDVEMGNDLSRILPTELMKLQDLDREIEFLMNYQERRCLQYALKGKEKKARGPIVCCIDESGSMGGDSEIWSKGVALALYHIAARQKRSFFVIHFDHTDNPASLPVHAFPKNAAPNMMNMVEMAEMFMNGGTNFEAPLTRARQCIDDDGEYHKADIVFITDGECAVRDSWLKEFNKWKKEKGISLFSVLIDAGYNSDSSLKEFSSSIFKLSALTGSSSEEIVMDIFAKV
jgi:uncharacterized protein with von Willebrand factor type A (vWA) domain